MSQIFNIVKCVECSTYQVDINKKSTNQWTCKICSKKQSLKQVYFQGDSKECRSKVQAMNMIKNEIKNQTELKHLEQYEQKSNTFSAFNDNQECVQVKKQSKWTKYLSDDDDE